MFLTKTKAPMMDETTDQSFLNIQEILLSLLPLPSALLSVVSSSLIIHLVTKKNFKSPYQRILFGLSVSDLIVAFNYALQPYLLPAETSRFPFTIGNDFTCTALGFTAHLILINAFYSAFLSFYFFTSVCLGLSEEDFTKRYERGLHVWCVSFPAIASFVPMFFGFYGELDNGPFCWITGPSPSEEPCLSDPGAFECYAPLLLGYSLLGIWAMLSVLITIVCNMAIFCLVRSEIIHMNRLSADMTAQNEAIQKVKTQAFLYVGTFFGTYIWSMIVRANDGADDGKELSSSLFVISVLQAVLSPLTGFFNLLVYLRPRYMNVRESYPEEGRLWALKQAYYDESVGDRSKCQRKSKSAPTPPESQTDHC